MTRFLARAKVIATSAVTYITTGSAIVIIAADEISKIAPSWGEQITYVATRVVAVGGAVVAIIRRSIPAPPAERGLLPNVPQEG
jgi:hypothetical protein